MKFYLQKKERKEKSMPTPMGINPEAKEWEACVVTITLSAQLHKKKIMTIWS